MTAAALTVLLALLVGVPLIRVIDRSISGTQLIGAGFIAGTAVISLDLLFVSLLGLRWSKALLLIPLIAIGLTLWIVLWRKGRPSLGLGPVHGVALAIDLATVSVVIGHLLFSTVAPPAESDFMTIWGLKGKTFWLAGGVDFGFLTSPWSAMFHVDYPVLLPLLYDAVAIIHGGWIEPPLGAMTTAFGGAALLIVRGESSRILSSPLLSALITLGLSGVLLSPWIGLAEGPLAACVISGVLVFRKGLLEESPSTMRAGAVLLGCAALVKNEGIALVLAVAIAVVIVTRQMEKVKHLWTAAAVVTPWLVVRSAWGLTTDLAREGAPARIIDRLIDPAGLISIIASTGLGRPLLWAGILAGFAVASLRLIRQERFVLSVVTLQFGAYLLAYMASPHDLIWHVTWSWERLVSHLLPLLVFVIAIQLVRVARPDSELREAPR